MSNMDFWGQSWWQGISGVISIIGLVLTVITIILSLNQNRSKQKRLGYKIIYWNTLLNIDSQVENDLQITYKHTPIDTPYMFEIQIENFGEIPIRKNDFEKPIEVSFTAINNLFDAQIFKKQPDDLLVSINQSDNILIISPLLLNPGDSFTLRVILDTKVNSHSFSVKSRIEGVNKIESIDQIALTKATNSTRLESILVMIYMSGDYCYERFTTHDETSTIIFSIFSAMILIATIISLFSTYKLRPYQYLKDRKFKK